MSENVHGNETCETPECFQTLILLFMLPVFGANLLQALYGTVDLMVVGQFASTADVSAVSTGSMTMQTITGLTMGCTVRIGHLIGQKIRRKPHAPSEPRFLCFSVSVFCSPC